MMKKIITILLVAFFIYSCKKEEKIQPPTITFKFGESYTKNGAIVQVGRKLYFGIQANSGVENITNFTIKKVLNNGSVITVLDSGLNSSSLDVNKLLYQNVEDTVIWTFTVMDKARLSSQITMVVYKDTNSQFGGIFYFPSIKLGYQNNTMFGHFFNPTTGTVYSADSASAFSGDIDILCYYVVSSGTPSPVLSSPGEMDNGSIEAKTYYPYIADWSVRKYTLWDISVDTSPVTATDFYAAQNDSLLILSYHDVWGKKKFKWATTGKIIPFITQAGKKGLIHVINAESVDSGAMEIAIKIQQ